MTYVIDFSTRKTTRVRTRKKIFQKPHFLVFPSGAEYRRQMITHSWTTNGARWAKRINGSEVWSFSGGKRDDGFCLAQFEFVKSVRQRHGTFKDNQRRRRITRAKWRRPP